MANNKLPTNEDVAELLKISRVHNTDKFIELENFLCIFITWLKRIDGNEYKAESIHNCYASLARYLKEHSTIKPCNIWDSYKFEKALRILDGKMKKLQKKGLGETDQSAALTVDEIFQILDHESMSGNDNESLVRHVFFWFSLLCGLRGGDTAKLKVSDISHQPHDLQNGIWFKISSMGEKKLGTMMLQIADLTKINLDNGHKITNHLLRRTVIQRLKDLNIPEDERMEFLGHRSREGIKAYNNSNEDQKIQNTDNPEIYNDSIFMTAAENYAFDNGPELYNKYSDSSNSSPILPLARSNYDKRSTFRSCIPRLSSHRSPLKSVSNQAAPYYIPTFHDIKKLHESSSDSNNKQEIHYHFHYHL
ncbi:4484_t:CDS:2 [Cetraspora pellucida]|uniref:4484_t:CDS:1 n=1 Tax=Cetraspora pellucida TaxID=1433469 RepID=A0A9N9HR55_9GLOM|nr:4484_t:CDS:2 [Cetraspora pellucida]